MVEEELENVSGHDGEDEHRDDPPWVVGEKVHWSGRRSGGVTQYTYKAGKVGQFKHAWPTASLAIALGCLCTSDTERLVLF